MKTYNTLTTMRLIEEFINDGGEITLTVNTYNIDKRLSNSETKVLTNTCYFHNKENNAHVISELNPFYAHMLLNYINRFNYNIIITENGIQLEIRKKAKNETTIHSNLWHDELGACTERVHELENRIERENNTLSYLTQIYELSQKRQTKAIRKQISNILIEIEKNNCYSALFFKPIHFELVNAIPVNKNKLVEYINNCFDDFENIYRYYTSIEHSQEYNEQISEYYTLAG